jgi:putative addiction module component (TIGR02574 family)
VALEGAAEVAVVGQAGRDGDLRERRFRGRQLASGLLQAQSADILTGRAAVVAAKLTGKVSGMHAYRRETSSWFLPPPALPWGAAFAPDPRILLSSEHAIMSNDRRKGMTAMAATTEELKAQLASLPIEDRAELAHYLIDTLDEAVDPDAEVAWDAELKRRGAQIRSGTAAGEAAASVFARLRDRLP